MSVSVELVSEAKLVAGKCDKANNTAQQSPKERACGHNHEHIHLNLTSNLREL